MLWCGVVMWCGVTCPHSIWIRPHTKVLVFGDGDGDGIAMAMVLVIVFGDIVSVIVGVWYLVFGIWCLVLVWRWCLVLWYGMV